MNIGIDIGGSHIGVALVNIDKILAAREEKITQEDKENINEELKKKIIKHIEGILEEKKISTKEIGFIGISSAGVIEKGHIKNAVNLKIDDFNITKELELYFKIPIKLGNDSQCAAMAEKKYGYLKDYDNGMFICLGTGIGGKLFEEGRLLSRYGNIGHMIIKKEGKICPCGRKGCFERYCSMGALKKQMKERLKIAKTATGRELLEMVRANTDQVEDILQEFISYLAIGLANIVNISRPDIVCIGGSFSYYEDILLGRLRKELEEKMLLDKRLKDMPIKIAKFKNDAGMIGAGNLD